MRSTRTERYGRQRSHRRRVLVIAAVCASVLAVVAVAVALTRPHAPELAATSSSLPATPAAPLSAEATLSAPSDEVTRFTPETVEVPKVAGKSLVEAEMVLTIAGFEVQREVVSRAPADADRRVLTQRPAAGAKVDAGTVVVLGHAPAPSKAPSPPAQRYVVAIDPGHQARADSRTEPIGPGSSERKPRVSAGATGVSTGNPEHEIVLQISVRLKRRLEAAGVRVVMTRTTADVDLANSQRAAIANRAGADLFLRVHCDGSTDKERVGISTLVPTANQWTKPIVARSADAGRMVQAAVVRRTGARDLGVVPRADLTGFNWSRVPTILVETGFLSNPAEDRMLATAAYQEKLAQGITEGVLAYLHR